MNKSKSPENIFPYFPPSLLEKTRRGRKKNFGSREKNYSCAEYTPLQNKIVKLSKQN